MTELGDVRLLDINSSGNAIPPVVVFDATTPSPTPTAIPDLEPSEGMVVSFEGMLSRRIDSVKRRLSSAAIALSASRASSFLSEPGLPVWDGNPEVFEIDPNGLGGPDAEIFVDQTVSAEGPLFFHFR